MAAAFDDDTPQPTRRDTYPIISAKIGLPVKVIVLSDRPVGTWTHYFQGHSYPCPRQQHSCPFDHSKFDPRWKGYIAAVTYPQGKRVLVELTAGAVNSCKQLGDRAGILRGQLLSVFRTGERSNSPVSARLEPLPATAARWTLPEPWDIREALLTHYWRDPIVIADQLPRCAAYVRPADQGDADDGEIPC